MKMILENSNSEGRRKLNENFQKIFISELKAYFNLVLAFCVF